MTNVLAVRDGDTYTLEANHHATGSETVCAGISAITQSLRAWCLNQPDLQVHCARCKPGDFRLSVSGAYAQAPFETAVLGLVGIALQYPDYVTVDAERFL